MASLYRRKHSPFWWIKFRTAQGELRYESTGLRIGVGKDTRLASEIVAEKTLIERRTRGVVAGERWEHWVLGFFGERYRNKPQSHLRYTTAWRTVKMFLAEKSVFAPRLLTRQDCQLYFDWRKTADKRLGKYKAGHNTALLEVKTLGLVMREAVIRGYAPANPCRELGIQRVVGKIKPVYSPTEIVLVRKAARKQKEPLKSFLVNSFEIARYQGCRLSETYLNPLKDVDLENGRITFRAKGGKEHVTRLHPKLIPLFKSLIKRRVTETYRPVKSPAKTWFNFLKSIGLKDSKPHLCFHSLRVTVATELARANVHESKAMRFLGHASTTVHRSYQRLRPDDLEEAVNAVS